MPRYDIEIEKNDRRLLLKYEWRLRVDGRFYSSSGGVAYTTVGRAMRAAKKQIAEREKRHISVVKRHTVET